MTFKQLIDKYSFEEIVPEITELWDKGNIYLFRQAHEILRRLQPNECVEGYVINVNKVVNDYESYFRVSNLSGRDWEENLNWEIIVSDDCDLSEKQLLALCLWERTFYGFSPQQEIELFAKWDKEIETDTSEPTETVLRQKFIADISSKYSDIDPYDLQFVHSTDNLKYHTFIGLADSLSSDIEYIIESITKYSDLSEAVNKANCIVLLCTPYKNMKKEWNFSNLSKAIESKIGCIEPYIYKRVSTNEIYTTLTIIYS